MRNYLSLVLTSKLYFKQYNVYQFVSLCLFLSHFMATFNKENCLMRKKHTIVKLKSSSVYSSCQYEHTLSGAVVFKFDSLYTYMGICYQNDLLNIRLNSWRMLNNRFNSIMYSTLQKLFRIKNQNFPNEYHYVTIDFSLADAQ